MTNFVSTDAAYRNGPYVKLVNIANRKADSAVIKAKEKSSSISPKTAHR